MGKLAAPAILIFLCGIGVGFSLFPHVMPQGIASSEPSVQAETPAPTAQVEHDDFAGIEVPALPIQKPLTVDDQESYVLQLFSPTSSQVNEMQTESEQTKLLEQTMMISYLLSNCGYMKSDEYKKTYIALVQYLITSGDPTPHKTASDAAARAQASYRMVYRHISCSDPSLNQMATSLAEWRNSISTDIK